jgi:hydroxylamine oxidation protein HaoB
MVSAEPAAGPVAKGSLRPAPTFLFGAALCLGGAVLVALDLLSPAPTPVPADVPLPFEERATEVPLAPPLDGLAGVVAGKAAKRIEFVDRSSGAVVATGTFLEGGGDPPVPVAWESTAAEPVLRPDLDPAEELRLVEALRRHLEPGATVLAFPERARRLVRLAGVVSPLAGADDTAGLFVPKPWLGAAASLRARERERAGIGAEPAAQAALEAWLDALLAPPARGTALLQLLAGGRGAHLVLHLADAFTAGLMRPDDVAVGLHDLPAGGAVHDSIRLVKEWVRSQGYAAYAVLPREPMALRVFFLTRAEDRDRLLTHLLPFDSADLGALPEVRLVFQHRGYWVWRLDPVAGEEENS